MNRFREPKGFTLIELMLVVAIIGLLSSIAIPKFANLIIKSKEAAVKGHLGAFRSAISIYYADNEGLYPQGFFSFTTKYIESIPRIGVPTWPSHRNGSDITGPPVTDWAPVPGKPAPAWVFNPLVGELVVNCTHSDSTGQVWSTW
jgi:general secretion pathway protein G